MDAMRRPRRPRPPRLPELVLVEREVLAEQRHRHRRPHGVQQVEAPLEVLLVGEHRDGGRPVARIGGGQAHGSNVGARTPRDGEAFFTSARSLTPPGGGLSAAAKSRVGGEVPAPRLQLTEGVSARRRAISTRLSATMASRMAVRTSALSRRRGHPERSPRPRTRAGIAVDAATVPASWPWSAEPSHRLESAESVAEGPGQVNAARPGFRTRRSREARYARNSSARSGRARANSTVALRKPSLSPVS